MNRQELFELMRKAGFNVDWVGYGDAGETVSKFERFAELVENKLKAQDHTQNEIPGFMECERPESNGYFSPHNTCEKKH